MSSSNSSFFQHVRALQEKVTYRLAIDEEDIERIGRLRHEAYLMEGLIERDIYPDGIFQDPYDYQGKRWNLQVFIEGEFVAALRAHLLDTNSRIGPTYKSFTDILDPILDSGKTILDFSRFAIDYRASRHHPQLPYVTFRLLHMAQRYFQADYCILGIRASHQAFWKRYFMYEAISEPRSFPNINVPVILIQGTHQNLEMTAQKYPFLESTSEECDKIFGTSVVEDMAYILPPRDRAVAEMQDA